jgi:hypothetical protein
MLSGIDTISLALFRQVAAVGAFLAVIPVVIVLVVAVVDPELNADALGCRCRSGERLPVRRGRRPARAS